MIKSWFDLISDELVKLLVKYNLMSVPLSRVAESWLVILLFAVICKRLLALTSALSWLIKLFPKGVELSPEESKEALINAIETLNNSNDWNEEELPRRWQEIIDRNGMYLADADHPYKK